MSTASGGLRVYPAVRALEHVASLAGVRPLRLFPVLWPHWQVETTASVEDEQAYEVIDRFLTRAIAETQIYKISELVGFFGLPEGLVERCLTFLATIGHLHVDAGTVRLTELGLRSAGAGVRYVAKESRQDLLVERFTAQPLPRRYYGALPIFSTPEVPEDRKSDLSRFAPLFAATPFRAEIVEKLTSRPDRAELNLRPELRDLRVVQERDAFMPAYVVETADSGLLVYTALIAERDEFFEAVCRQVPAIHHMIDAEDRGHPRETWTGWLANGQAGRGTLSQLPNGIWRATMRADVFKPGGLPLRRIGSFELRGRYFLQVWSEDSSLRRAALLERVLAMTQSPQVITRAQLQQRADALAEQLAVARPSLAQVREYGIERGEHARVARLDVLE